MARAAEALKHTSVAAARTGCGLDNTRANVMIADEQNTIIYCNRSVIETLKKAEADIRRDLPDFDASALVGRNVDVFHTKPAHKRRMLAGMKGTSNSRISVDGGTFDPPGNQAVPSPGGRTED